MRKRTRNDRLLQRVGAFVLTLVMVFGLLPNSTIAAGSAGYSLSNSIATVADPETVSSLADVYGNSTLNAGKVTVGKSVNDGTVTLENGVSFTPDDNNFLVTVSQTSQVMALAAEQAAPVDVVFVLDTSSSMSNSKDKKMVDAANNAIKTLLEANPYNRVAVVGFSGVSGRGNTDGYSASVLSELKHYDDNGNNKEASEHLTYSNQMIQGRRMIDNARASRSSRSGGTNFHAGVYLGAQQLMNATDIQVNINGTMVTRMPFLVLLSDGEPSYAADDVNDNGKWYEPSLTSQLGRQYPADGLSFLAILTAAYYKGAISEKYFGTNASAQNRCFVYSVGLDLTNISDPERAEMMLDPSGRTSQNNKHYGTFTGYWNNYTSGKKFSVPLGSGNYEITADSIKNSSNYVNGKLSNGTSIGYAGGYKYNDKYYPANDVNSLAGAFDDMVSTIQLQAMSSPTRVDAVYGNDFSGYVNFYDPIGEYMEVKQVHGLMTNGTLFQGKSVAQHLQNWSTAPQGFKDSFIKILQERCKVTGSTMDAEDFIAKALASSNQAYYRSDSDYDNSLVWWGQSYTPANEEDPQIKWLGFADNDTAEYIEQQKAAGKIPAGADYVCRSYYYYGTAGGSITNPDTEYLHFVVRVQRSLTAPYQETVVVSAPASLLSVEKVLITENSDGNGQKTYTAAVTPEDPVRVVYEVGLRSDINPFNVDQIVGKDTAYTSESAITDGKTVSNYFVDSDGAGNYTFFTNDWDRTEGEDEHHRAMAKATFDAAADNSFYTYQQDTLLYTWNGSAYVPYTGSDTPVGTGFFYARTYYDWGGETQTNGVYNAEKLTEYIPVTMPANPRVTKKADGWYINKGIYTASSLANGEYEREKDENRTGSAVVAAHPHRTEDETNSHYTVLLGNNGKLTLKSEKTKFVAKESAPTVDADGQVVMVGDVLTYTIRVVNPENAAATADVEDSIPKGTEYVANSASDGGQYDSANKKIVWTGLALDPNETKTISFQVRVTTDLVGVVTIDNAAHVELSNGFTYTTNTVKNPPEGKRVVDKDYNELTENSEVAVPDVLEFRILWQNDTDAPAKITITDELPDGMTFISASHDGKYDKTTKTVTWTLTNIAANTSGVVSLFANVNPNAGETLENDATIKVNDNPTVRVTNEVEVKVKKDDLILSKTVTANDLNSPAFNESFKLDITEVKNVLEGTLKLYKLNDQNVYEEVQGGITFDDGNAHLDIKHGETFKIEGIPEGTIFSIAEHAKHGYTPTYIVNGTATTATEGRVTIVDGGAKVDVTNAYAPNAVEFKLKANKVLTAIGNMEDQRFGFTAYRCDADGQNLVTTDMITGEVNVSAGNDDPVAVNFGTKVFTETGTYYYLISEIDGGVKGMTYDESQYLLRIVVVDDGSGELKVATVEENPTQANDVTAWKKLNDANYTNYSNTSVITFNNSYAPLSVDLTLTGTKTMVGRTLEAGRYAFVVKDSAGKEVSTGTNNADGSITFKPITYNAQDLGNATSKVITYTVSEVVGSLAGVTYDTKEYTVTVTLTNNGGQLAANVTKIQLAGNAANSVVFTNTYDPDPAKLELTGTKRLTNNSGDTSVTLDDQQFPFLVKDSGGNVVATGNNGAGVKHNGAEIFDAPIVFTPIVYHVEDLEGANSKTFTYTVEELVPDLAKDPNMYYDNKPVTVTVTVSYDATTGVLSVGEPALQKDNATVNAINFHNVLQPSTVDVPLAGSKTTTPAGLLPASLSFSFTVKDMNGNVVSGGNAPANGAITFTNLTYDTPGTYYYWIYESNHPGQFEHGVQYSGNRYLAVVTVDRNDVTLAWEEPVVTYYEAGTFGADGQLTGTNNPEDYVGNSSPTAMSFANTYSASGAKNITATKALSGNRLLNAGDFQFVLERLELNADGTVAMNGNEPVVKSSLYASNSNTHTVENGVKYASIEFPSIIFGSGDLQDHDSDSATPATVTYKYRIREIEVESNKLPGVTYSNAVYYFTITATDNGEGGINTDVVYYTDYSFNTQASVTTPVFENVYAPAVGTSARIVGTKDLTGRALREGEFVFDLYHINENDEEVYVDTAHNMDADGDGKYNDIVFVRNYPATILGSASSRTVEYVIRERNNNLGGVTYDTNTDRSVTVTITDDGSGTLSCQVDYDATNDSSLGTPFAYANSYSLQGVSFTPAATKTLNNRKLVAGEFSFIVEEKVDDTTWRTVSTGTNGAPTTDPNSAVVNFTEIGFRPIDLWDNANRQYLDSKTFTYKISEVQGNLDNVEYTDAEYYVDVTVTQANGTMNIGEVKYYTMVNDVRTDVTGAAFINVYHPDNISIQLSADKILTGRNMLVGEFSFLAKEVVNGTVTDRVVATGGNAAANSGSSAEVLFSNIGYQYSQVQSEPNQTKAFIYELSEVQPSQGGVSFKLNEDNIFYAKVTVSYDQTAAALSAVVAYYDSADCTGAEVDPVFENTYAPTDVQLTLPVDKTLINKAIVEDEFTFTLTGAGYTDEATNDENGVVAFAPITFTQPGVYQYTVSERVTDTTKQDLYTLDDSVTVVVTVEDDLQGHLVAHAEYFVNYVGDGTDINLGGVDFVNYYTAPALTVDLTAQIDATKKLTGRELREGEFKFNVYDIHNTVVATATNKDLDSDGKFDELKFTDFTFNSAGEYRYWIVESDENVANGVTIDSRAWEVQIQVRYNEDHDPLGPDPVIDMNGDAVDLGKLYVSAQDVKTYLITREAGEDDIAPVFENVYTPAPAVMTIEAEKELAGRDLRNGEFLFELVEDGVVVGNARNDADGNIVYNMIYNTAGFHSYNMREVNEGLAGITYTVAPFLVNVEVTDDLNGHLVASVTYATADGQAPVFKNTYKAAPVEIEILANKIITGDKTFIEDEIFNFKLTNDADSTETYTASSDAEGKVKFALELKEAGTYIYTLSEVAGTDTKHFSYDTNTYKVTVTVTDDEAGKLLAEVSYGTADAAAPVFENRYTADPVIIVLEGEKKLEGRDMVEDEFKFQVHDSQGNLVGTATNAEDGELIFTPIALPVVGNYTLTVTEVKGDAQYVTYDATQFQVKAIVTNEDGKLVAQVQYPEGGIVFKNVYEEPETEPTTESTTEPTTTPTTAPTTEPTKPGTSVVPDTGDHSNMLGYGTLAVVSLGAAMLLILLKKHRKVKA